MITYRDALRESLRDALKSDKKVFLMGEDIGAYGGAYAVSKGLLEEFGPDRIRDTPLSELGFTGIGIGAAMGGVKPIVEIMTVNFSLLALDQIMNTAAFMSHMSGGQLNVPVVIRMTTGGGRQLAAQHSNSLEGWYAHIPGIKILAPGTVQDARFMLSEALKDPNPVLIFEHALLFNENAEEPKKESNYSAFNTIVRRKGDKLSIITYGGMVSRALAAAARLESQGHSVEVVDLRCLRPLDMQPVYESIKKTHRALIVDEGWQTGSLAAEISARITENCFYDLDGPVRRLCRQEIPVPYAKHLEDAMIPQVEDIERTVKEILS